MAACIMEWGHSQSLDKWSDHPSAEDEYTINVSEFLMYAGLETLFLGPEDKESHTILFLTFRPNRTTAKEQKGTTRGKSTEGQGQRHFEGPGQDQVKGQRPRKVSLPASSEPKTLSPKRYGIAQFQARLLLFALSIFTEMVRALHLPAVR